MGGPLSGSSFSAVTSLSGLTASWAQPFALTQLFAVPAQHAQHEHCGAGIESSVRLHPTVSNLSCVIFNAG